MLNQFARSPLTCGIILTVLISPLSSASSEDAQSVANLAGLWAAKRDFTPDVGGTLRISNIDGHIRADFSGFSVDVTRHGNDLDFELPGNRGYFRGSMTGNEIKGHWVQPRTQSNFAPYASPVFLQALAAGRWQGEVTLLNDSLHFYLMLQAEADGSVTGFMRNPEANIGRFYTIARVVRTGNAIQFFDGNDRLRLEGFYHESTGQLSVHFPYNGGTYDFERADDDPGVAFYPRPKTDPPYEYVQPIAGEGWETASLPETGISEKPIEDMIRMIINTPQNAVDAPYLHAFLLARHGKLVLEEYFHGYTREQPHGTRSASKSITATLAGIAVNDGLLSLDTPVYKTMYGGSVPEGLDERAGRMVLENLITMTPGFACNDFDQNSPGNEDTMQNQDGQPDWFQFTLDLEMLHEPGEFAAYCSGSQNLAGGVVARATGQWLPDFYRDRFATQLDMGLYHMNLSPTGEGYGGGGLIIKSRDFLKLGQVFLDAGKWQGKRVVSEQWVRDGTDAINDIGDEGYGYGWWIFSYSHEGRSIKAYYAGGNGGQYVIVVPELDLNIVIFAGNYNQRVMHKPKYEFVRDYVLPAIDRSPVN